jgi:hypothetical protein
VKSQSAFDLLKAQATPRKDADAKGAGKGGKGKGEGKSPRAKPVARGKVGAVAATYDILCRNGLECPGRATTGGWCFKTHDPDHAAIVARGTLSARFLAEGEEAPRKKRSKSPHPDKKGR